MIFQVFSICYSVVSSSYTLFFIFIINFFSEAFIINIPVIQYEKETKILYIIFHDAINE